MKEWRKEELENYLGTLRTRGFAAQELIRQEVLDTVLCYEFINEALKRPEGVAFFKHAIDRISGNVLKIIEQCLKSGKTGKTVETIIPVAQEIAIIINFLNEWSRVLVTGKEHIDNMTKERKNAGR